MKRSADHMTFTEFLKDLMNMRHQNLQEAELFPQADR